MNALTLLIFSTFVFIAIKDFATAKRIHSFAGPYTAVVKYTNNNTDEFKSSGKNWSRIYYSAPKAGKPEQFARGMYYSEIELTDKLRIDVRVSVRSNNMWKRNAFVIKVDHACSALMFHARCIINLFYTPEERKCPLPKIGFRTVQNQSFEPVFPQFPVVPYGIYRFTMAVLDGDEVVGINVSEAEARPKL